MSWSFSGVWKPAALKTAIDKHGSVLTGNSKDEFEHASAHLKGLLDAAHDEAAVHIDASGHASFADGKRTYAGINVAIKQLGAIYT